MNQLPIGWRPLDDDGAIIPGAKANFYRTGTSTRKDTYSVKALTAGLENANPVVADADGQFSPIFLKKDEAYRLVLTTSAGVVIDTIDEVFAPSLAVDEQTRRKGIATSPMDHGATGDGVANDATAILAAIAAGVVIDGEGKTYRCDSTIALSSRQVLRNITIDFSSCASNEYIQIHGSVGTYTDLTSNAAAQAVSLAITADPGFAAGDLLALDATDLYTDDGRVGEICRVSSISGLTVTLAAPLLDRYNTASTARVAKITTVDDVRLEGVRLVASKSASGSGPAVISARSTRRLTVRDCRISGIKTWGMLIAGCVETTIDNCTIEDADSTSTAIFIGSATQDTIVTRCKFARLDDGVGFGTYTDVTTVARGVRRRITVEHCFFEAMSGTPIGFYRDSQFCKALWNEFNLTGSTAAITAECMDVEIVGNRLNGDDTGGISLPVVTPNRSVNYSILVSKNELHSSNEKPITYAPAAIASSASLASLVISDNRGTNGSVVVTLSVADEDITDLLIANNDFSRSANNGGRIAVTSSNASAAITNALITGNKCTLIAVTGTTGSIADLNVNGNQVGTTPAVSTKLVDIDACARVWLSGNVIRGDTSAANTGVEITAATGSVTVQGGSITGLSSPGVGLFIDEAPRIAVSGVYIHAAGHGIEIDNTTQEFTGCVITGCYVRAEDGDALEVDASDATGSNGLVVAGNYFETAAGANEWVLNITGIINGIALSGNTFNRLNDTDANVHIAGDGAGNITNLTAVGNHVRNGDVGLEFSNNTDTSSFHSANAFDSTVANDAGAATTAAPVDST